MLLKKLTVAEMLAISQPWTDPKSAANQAMSEVPEVAALLPRAKAAHERLLKTQRFEDPRIGALQAEAAAIDEEHDDLVRGLDSLCEALSYLAEPAERPGWQRIQKALLPQGQSLLNASYSAEAGAALQVPQRLAALSEEDRKLPAALVLGKRTAQKIIDRWLASAAKLGELERQRQSLQSAGPSAAEVHTARLEWIRVAQALLAMAEMADQSETLSPHLHTPLREATARAASRRSATKPKDTPPEDPSKGSPPKDKPKPDPSKDPAKDPSKDPLSG